MANAGNGAKDAVSGASMGAAFGPWGAAAGGVAGGLYGLLSDDGSDAKKAAAAAEQAKIAQEHQNAIALSNYRLNSKNQYDQLKNNEYAQYAPYSQLLQAAYGQGMAGPQKSAVSLADTGVGAPQGSNAAGWDTYEHVANPVNGGFKYGVTHHTGYNEYLNGTASAPGTQTHGVGPDGRRTETTTVDANAGAGGVPQTVAPTFMPGSNAITPANTVNNGAGLSFFPRGR